MKIATNHIISLKQFERDGKEVELDVLTELFKDNPTPNLVDIIKQMFETQELLDDPIYQRVFIREDFNISKRYGVFISGTGYRTGNVGVGYSNLGSAFQNPGPYNQQNVNTYNTGGFQIYQNVQMPQNTLMAVSNDGLRSVRMEIENWDSSKFVGNYFKNVSLSIS